MIRRYYLLMILAHMGPMTSKELWEHLWGEGGADTREKSKRIFGFYPNSLDYDLAQLREQGYIISLGTAPGRSYTWRAI